MTSEARFIIVSARCYHATQSAVMSQYIVCLSACPFVTFR